MSNPYTLVFGQPPMENIERTALVERIISDIEEALIRMLNGIKKHGICTALV